MINLKIKHRDNRQQMLEWVNDKGFTCKVALQACENVKINTETGKITINDKYVQSVNSDLICYLDSIELHVMYDILFEVNHEIITISLNYKHSNKNQIK